MPRKPREEMAGAIHHVFARGNRKQAIFLGPLDQEIYIEILAAEICHQGWRCLEYSLMPNHVHLLVETPEPNLGIGIRRVHGLYAQDFNVRHGLSGHLFQGRYGSRRITSDAQLWTTARYIVQNPVEAGLCAAPADWQWGSHRAIAAGRPPPWLDVARLMELFSCNGGDPRERYLDHVR